MSLPGRLLHVGGHRVFVHRQGKGRPLVLIHGYLTSHWSWRHVVPKLAEAHDVIALDLLGFGESDRPSPTVFRYDAPAFTDLLVEVLDTLGLDRASLVGHSMGGGVALFTAARRPERVDRLVVVDPLVYSFEVPIEGLVLRTPLLGPLIMKTLYTRSVLRRFMRNNMYRDPSLVTPEWVDYVWERLNRPGGMDAAHAALALNTDPSAITRAVRAVRAPTLIVWGEDDRMFPSSRARRLGDDIAGSEITLIAACGHTPHEEQPDEFLRAALPFLARRNDMADKRAMG